ncbi:MAG: hypothetical protein IJZ50_05435 [Alistipes sp.]|nr:hypothetical protein [Alistipes sp.]
MMAQIATKGFFSGRVDLTVGDTFCSLICTLVVHRGKPSEESSLRPIERLVPVWWEFRTIEGGEEILNDFSFREMLAIAL